MSEQIPDGLQGLPVAFEPFGKGVSKPVGSEIWNADLLAQGLHSALQRADRGFDQGSALRGISALLDSKGQPCGECLASDQVQWDRAFLAPLSVPDQDK